MPALRASGLLGVILLVAWTQLFLGVHELKHIGQSDSSACKLALVTSTVGGGSTQSTPSVLVPSVLGTLAVLPVLSRVLSADVVPHQARAPPTAA